MRILVTGAAGYIGSNFALSALKHGYEVLGVDAFLDYYDPTIKRHTAGILRQVGVEVVEADLLEVEGAKLLEGVDAVAHFAGQPGISAETPWEHYNRNNVVATHSLIEAARKAEVSRFINISSSSVYGIRAMDTEVAEPKPASWYGETKLAAELEVMGAYRLFGFPACSLRLFSVYGERERPEKLFPKLIRSISQDLEFPLFEGSGAHQRSFTYVGDVCDGVLSALENWERAKGGIFNLGTDQCFSTEKAIRTVEELMGKRAKLKNVPARPGDQKATHANIDKIRDSLGWEPRTDLSVGLAKMVKWYRDEVEGEIDWK